MLAGVDLLLIALALLFAWSMGAHYTGACMGMATASGAIDVRRALLLMAPLTFLGALVASGAVETTVGTGLLTGASVSVVEATAIVGCAFGLTSAYNLVKLPTSTIQILVFSVVGVGLAAGQAVQWSTIARLMVVCAAAPPAAALIAYLVTRWVDRTRTGHRIRDEPGYLPQIATGLLAAGAGASFVMGANDVSNASGSFIMAGLFGLVAAGGLGGVGLAVGVLTWGRPLLKRVAFETVRLDRLTAMVAQLVQAGIVIVSVAFGYFTSLNQALVGAMAGTGWARGGGAVNRRVLRSIVTSWAVGPVSGLLLGFATGVGLVHLGWM